MEFKEAEENIWDSLPTYRVEIEKDYNPDGTCSICYYKSRYLLLRRMLKGKSKGSMILIPIEKVEKLTQTIKMFESTDLKAENDKLKELLKKVRTETIPNIEKQKQEWKKCSLELASQTLIEAGHQRYEDSELLSDKSVSDLKEILELATKRTETQREPETPTPTPETSEPDKIKAPTKTICLDTLKKHPEGHNIKEIRNLIFEETGREYSEGAIKQALRALLEDGLIFRQMGKYYPK